MFSAIRSNLVRIESASDLDAIAAYLVEHKEVTMTVSLPVAYEGDEQSNGFDPKTKEFQAQLDGVMEAAGYKFIDAGVEEDGSGEYWIYQL